MHVGLACRTSQPGPQSKGASGPSVFSPVSDHFKMCLMFVSHCIFCLSVADTQSEVRFVVQHGDSTRPSTAGRPPVQPPSVVTQRWHRVPDDTACAVPFTPPQIKNRNTQRPATARPGSHPKTTLFMLTFVAAPTMAKTWRRAERPLTEEPTMGMSRTNSGTALSQSKEGKPAAATTWADPEGIAPSEVSQPQKKTNTM